AASGLDPLGNAVIATATTPVDVIHPSLSIVKTITPSPARPGEPLTYQFVVTNTGDVPLIDVVVKDLPVRCSLPIGPMTAGSSITVDCPGTALAGNPTNTATVTGTPPVGPPVTADGSATLDLVNPGISLTKTATPVAVRPGDVVTFTVTVTNTGDTPLSGIILVDKVATDCTRTLPDLAAGQSTTFS